MSVRATSRSPPTCYYYYYYYYYSRGVPVVLYCVQYDKQKTQLTSVCILLGPDGRMDGPDFKQSKSHGNW